MLIDPRIEQLAEVLLRHSLALEKGDIFQLNASLAARPLAAAICRLASVMGVFPVIRWQDEEINRLAYDLLSPDQPETRRFLEAGSRWEMVRWQDMAANLSLRAPDNDQENSSVPREKLQLAARAGEKVNRLIIDRRRWALFCWPTPAQAQKAGMSTAEYFDFVLNVSLVDYNALHEAEKALAARMETADQVRILAPGTDLTFSIRGIPAVCCYGRRNVPDGEVYTAPVRNSIEGRVAYNVPTTHWGKTYRSIWLEFSRGRIIKAGCDGDAGTLEEILDTDEGARYIGEFSFGVNPRIARPTGSILFDEKMTGSLHLTPGNAYARADNGNKSLLHWDLILDQRAAAGGGEIWFDGVLIRKDGLFIPSDLRGLNP